MIGRNADGDITITADDRSELIGILKEIFNTTEIGKIYKADYYTGEHGDEHVEKLVAAAELVAGGPNISVSDLTRAIELLIASGEIQHKDFQLGTPLEEPEVDTRPRGKDGKFLTEAQLKEQEYSSWSETASSSERKLRMQSDPGYATFVRKSLQAEMNQPIDGAIPVGEPKARANQHLAEFARKYLVEPTQNLRPRNGVVLLAGEQIPYPQFLELVNQAAAARLL